MAKKMAKQTDLVLTIFVAIAVAVSRVGAQGCVRLKTNSWGSLIDALDDATEKLDQGVVTLCPFAIDDTNSCAGSETGYTIQRFGWSIVCIRRADDEGSCVIDCPGRHFTVPGKTSLRLNGFTLRGATHSSVYVHEDGELQVENCLFQTNKNEEGNGGAIYAAESSKIATFETTFDENEARNGGAVFSIGTAELRDTTFQNNKATKGNGGSVFYNNLESELLMMEGLGFRGNSAKFFGDGVFDGVLSSHVVNDEIREGCSESGDANSHLPSDTTCSGSYDVGAGSCTPLDGTCYSYEDTIAPSASLAPSGLTETPTTLSQIPTTLTLSPTTLTQSPTTLTQSPTTLTQAPTTLTQIPTASLLPSVSMEPTADVDTSFSPSSSFVPTSITVEPSYQPSTTFGPSSEFDLFMSVRMEDLSASLGNLAPTAGPIAQIPVTPPPVTSFTSDDPLIVPDMIDMSMGLQLSISLGDFEQIDTFND